MCYSKLRAKQQDRREVAGNLGRADDAERSGDGKELCRVDQPEFLIRGKTLFGVKAQAVRRVCIFEQNVYSQTTYSEEVSKVPRVGLDLDQRR